MDSFNLPIYIPTKVELGSLIERNLCFSIERMEPLVRPARTGMAPSSVLVQRAISSFRAAMEEVIAGHFGNDIIDELFDRLTKKVVDQSSSFSSQSTDKRLLDLYVLLDQAQTRLIYHYGLFFSSFFFFVGGCWNYICKSFTSNAYQMQRDININVC
jgi:hypothetical protein